MNDYYSCMHYISKALERDSHYTKGLVLRDKMYQEQPCMKRECELLFKYCDVSVFDDHKITKEIAETIVEEAVEIRKKKRELLKPIPIPAVKFPQPLASLTWKSLGENLISLYEYINKHSKLSFGNHVDVTDHLSTTDEENMPSTDEPTEMETESENNSLEKSKKGVKRKRAGGSGGGSGGGGASEESHAKRRSARVRNTVKKKEETVNYKELLRTFLPSSLK
ncbi:calcineurin-binding protein cabin-1-like [Saccoglossus kowalevskii]